MLKFKGGPLKAHHLGATAGVAHFGPSYRSPFWASLNSQSINQSTTPLGPQLTILVDLNGWFDLI